MAEGTVLLRRSSLGDVVLLGSVTASLPPPVTVVTDPAWASLAARLPGVTEVVPWPDRPGGLPPGRLVDLQGSARSRWLTRGREVARIRKHGLRRRVRVWTGAGPPRPPITALYARACGVEAVPPPWLDMGGVREALALIPGAAWAPKRWDPARLAAVGRGWEGPVVVLGSAAERPLVDAVSGAVPGAVAVAEVGFEATLDWLGRTAVAVAGDTGLMHLAGACGARVVALFGPTHPDDGFFVHRGQALGLALPCRPCALHRVSRCHTGHHGCMGIATARVAAAVRDVRCAG